MICFYLGWSDSILPIRTNIIKVGSNSSLVTYTSNITLSLPSYAGSALKRELKFCNGYLSLLCFIVLVSLDQTDTLLDIFQSMCMTNFDLYFSNFYYFCWFYIKSLLLLQLERLFLYCKKSLLL